ncbi:MAG: hypothetical protein PHT33_11425 [bacterium]|nr:hypothetical protein [bacterium]
MRSLDISGENRPELVKALSDISKDRLPAMCNMITRMPRYDLTNITSRMLLDSVNSVFEINAMVPWRLDTNSKLFLDYVLPYRVSNENLENSRRDLQKFVYPVVRNCRTTEEAVAKMFAFALDAVPAQEIHLTSAYPYDYPPFASWKYGRLREGLGCRGQALFLAAALRSVGIPASMLEQATTLGSISDHNNDMYYSTSDKRWHPCSVADTDIGNDKGFVNWMKSFGDVTVCAKPPYVAYDLIGKQMYDKQINVGLHKFPSSILKVRVTSLNCALENAGVCVYIWCERLHNWYPVMLSRTNDKGWAELRLGSNDKFRPYMVSASKGELCDFQFVTLKAGETRILSLDISRSHDSGMVDVRATETLGEP